MRLNELLNSEVQYKVTEDGDRQYEEVAEINGRTIVFGADLSHSHTEVETDEWEVAFMEKQNHKTQWGTNSVKWSIEKTGSGGEMRVFAYVKAATERFVKQYKPEVFSFSANLKEESRVKLYTTLSQKFKPADYVLRTKQGRSVKYFIYIRKDSPHASSGT
jgi:hypothetical protein